MRNIFLEKSYTKCGGETITNLYKAYLWINSLEVLYSLFLFYTKLRAIEMKWNEDIEMYLQTTCFYLI